MSQPPLAAQPPLAVSESLTVEADRLAFASAWVREYCGWHIAPSVTESVRIRDTQGGTLLALPTLYLTALGTVTLTDPLATVPVIPPADIQWSTNGLISLLNGRLWPDGLSTVTVTFTHGYSVIPDAIKAVTVAVARRMTGQMDSVTGETVGGVSRQFAAPQQSGFTAIETTVLDRYRVQARP